LLFLLSKAQLGIKNITVAKGANANLSLNDNKSPKSETSNPSLNVPTTPVSQKSTENGARSVDLKTLFAKAQTARSNFGPVSLITKLDSAQLIKENKEKINSEEKNANLDEMLTPAMIDEKAKSQAQGEDKRLLISPVKPASHKNENVFIKNPPTSAFMVPFSTASTSNHTNNHYVQPISVEHLKNCLIHLIQNDDDFIRKIHSAYLSSSPP